MKKTYALLILILVGLVITWLIVLLDTGRYMNSTINSASPINIPPPPVFTSLDKKEGVCDYAPLFYLSLPAKCLTDEGLKTAVKQSPLIIPIENQK